MKYTTEITILLPREEFIKKMDDANNMKHWMRGLLDHKMLSDEPGQEGARMSMIFKRGKGEMEMIETIITRNFPDEFHATYDAKGVHNIQKNYFKEVDGGTKWISDTEFIFEGIGMKLLAFLMPGAFKKQSMKFAQDFKNFAENGVSVQES